MNFPSTRLPTFSGSGILQSLFIAYSCGAVADFHRASRASHQQTSISFPKLQLLRTTTKKSVSLLCNLAISLIQGLIVNGELLDPFGVLLRKFKILKIES